MASHGRRKKLPVTRYRIRYRRTTIYLKENPRTGICSIGGKKRKTDRHHWIEEFPTKEVKKNPELALENSVEVCFPHHDLANALRLIAEADLEDIDKLVATMPLKVQRAYFNFLSHETSTWGGFPRTPAWLKEGR